MWTTTGYSFINRQENYLVKLKIAFKKIWKGTIPPVFNYTAMPY